MQEEIQHAFNQAYQHAVIETKCRSMSDIDIVIREEMEDRGFEIIDDDKPNVPSNYTWSEAEASDGQPDAMQEWHDFDPDC